jgi:superfamily I DNA/RNA helicase
MIAPSSSGRIWSPAQGAIFDYFAGGTGHMVVRARAGTGKSTTILEGVERAPERRVVVAAFNKDIRLELGAKLLARGSRAEARTLHGLGYKVVTQSWPKARFDDGRGWRLARQAWADDTKKVQDAAPRPVITAVAKLAGLVKNIAPAATTKAQCLEVCLAMNVEVEGIWAAEYPEPRLAELALRALDLAKAYDGFMDYNDMVWLPVVHGWTRPAYDLMCVDEAQDLNRVQLELAIGLAGGRVCVIGDDRQAIYGWRGADSDAIDRLKAELDAAELPLTTTYRCPRSVVEVAQALVPDFQAPATAAAGEVRKCSAEAMLAGAAPGDFILSRINAPLAGICLDLLRMGKRARIQGREIGKSLVTLIKRMEADTVPHLLDALREHQQKLREAVGRGSERARAAAEVKLDTVTDQIDTIEGLSAGCSTVEELLHRIDTLFSDEGPAQIVCSTVHRVKGKEARTVYLLAWTLYRGRKRKPGDLEEQNIHYVGVTRSMERLMLVGKE